MAILLRRSTFDTLDRTLDEWNERVADSCQKYVNSGNRNRGEVLYCHDKVYGLCRSCIVLCRLRGIPAYTRSSRKQ
jgi:hypothetical protein